MERRLELHPMTDPTHHDNRDVVRPNRPSTTPLQNGIIEAPAHSELEVSPRQSLLRADALEGLSAERVAELRARLESSAYSSYDVVTALAVRMLESGDLEA